MFSAKLRKAFKGITIDAAFDFEDGITVLFGASGAGKSSIINMLAGLVTPDEAEISTGGRILFSSSQNINLPPEKRGAGYVFQDSRLFPHISVRKNILYGTKGKDASSISFDHITELLGISALLKRYPAALSGGEKQRIALARALMSSPEFLLMDEPMASLDAAKRDELIDYIAKVSSEFKIPTIYISHNLDEVIRLAKHVGLVNGGKLTLFGTALRVMNSPEMMALMPERDFGAIWQGLCTQVQEGLSIVDFGGGEIVLATELTVGTKLRLRIAAVDVLVSVQQPGSTSARNLFKGKVTALREHEHVTDIYLDINGQPLWARITAQSAKDMKLTEGSEAYALVKSVVAAQSIYKII